MIAAKDQDRAQEISQQPIAIIHLVMVKMNSVLADASFSWTSINPPESEATV